MCRQLLSTAENTARIGSSLEFTYQSTTVLWSEGEQIFVSTLQQPDFVLDKLHGGLVPKEALWDKWTGDLLEAPNPLPSATYVKKPWPARYKPNTPSIWMINEAKIYQKLQPFAHPNICEYFGAIREGEYCTGLALRKYPTTLRDAKDEGKVIDCRAVFIGLLQGIKFIHAQGLVHNDLQPGNIMLDENGTAIIIDFDGSDVVGGRPKKTGTFGWHNLNHIACRSNDYYSLALVGRWLRGEYDDVNHPIEDPEDDPSLQRILDDDNFQLDTLLDEFKPET